jgi:hypothetical protein
MMAMNAFLVVILLTALSIVSGTIANVDFPDSISMNLSIIETKFNEINRDGFGTRDGLSLTYVPQKHPIMSKDAWNLRTQTIENLPKAGISPDGISEISYPSSFSLLSHVPYNASERDQGYCGNCWVWGCTVPIEVANDIQNEVHDRLSIQYFNSNSWACCGGWELVFQDFYSKQGKIIPWNNTNASYQDSRRHCSDGTSVPASSISTTPNYSITSIQWHEILTNGVSRTQAIRNIKSYLYENKALTLGFYLPDFAPFRDFWGSNSGNWEPDSYCELPDGADPGGHEVTVVGWNDSTDSWIVLNSWGVDSAHPDGTFKLKMDMNYSCTNGGNSSYSFGYFDVTFGKTNTPSNAPTTPSGPSSGKIIETTYKYTTYAKDQDIDEITWIT